MRGKFVAYYRVSTDKQGKSGLGLEAQKKAVLDWFNHTSTGYPDGTFNTTKKARAIPDLAANAVNTVVASNGIWTSGGPKPRRPCVSGRRPPTCCPT